VLVDLASQTELDAHLLELVPERGTAVEADLEAQLAGEDLIIHASDRRGRPGGKPVRFLQELVSDTRDPDRMDQRISLITLGYRDYRRARDFYVALGWTERLEPDEEVVFFQAGGMIVALWDRALLTEDSAVQDGGGWGGVTFAYLVDSTEEVDDILARAEAAGGSVPRKGGKRPWGGYSGIFVDPEGHPWEVAVNPSWTLHEDGSVTLR
jgi:uncharacterized protein